MSPGKRADPASGYSRGRSSDDLLTAAILQGRTLPVTIVRVPFSALNELAGFVLAHCTCVRCGSSGSDRTGWTIQLGRQRPSMGALCASCAAELADADEPPPSTNGHANADEAGSESEPQP